MVSLSVLNLGEATILRNSWELVDSMALREWSRVGTELLTLVLVPGWEDYSSLSELISEKEELPEHIESP
jgi:hypothetical protein